MSLTLNGKNINVHNLWKASQSNDPITIDSSCEKKVLESRKYIESFLETDERVYGVNTGFGSLSDVSISKDKLIELQKNLIRSHSVGTGKPFTKEESRAIMILRANSLVQGHSGIRLETISKIIEYLNNDIIPVIPRKGSVGASGDLAPLAHLALTLMGEGYVWKNNSPTPTKELLQEKNISPIELKAKEGLSLINGCQMMTAVGLLSAHRIERILKLMDIVGAMSLEGLRGSHSAFDPILFSVRPHEGEGVTAKNILKVIGGGSEIAQSHKDCPRVQDPYSLRCMPAIHGSTKTAFKRFLKTLEIEANSCTDNPLVFEKEKKILSCGHFHGAPVAQDLDCMALSLTTLSSVSERRIEKFINPQFSQLEPFLVSEKGLHSGFMMLQVTAAALVSENKVLSHPASVDSIPTSADKEDHVSMGSIASRKLKTVVNNIEDVLAIEFFCAIQALDFLKPLKASGGVHLAHEILRKKVPFVEKDRVFSEDIKVIKQELDLVLTSVEELVGKIEI